MLRNYKGSKYFAVLQSVALQNFNSEIGLSETFGNMKDLSIEF